MLASPAVSRAGSLGGCDDVRFEVALDFILDGLERLGERRSSRDHPGR
jgi:hypothetical protein